MADNSVTLSSSAMSNLLSLRNTSALIDRTQIRLSTGRAVNSALDDAMAFFKSRNLTNRAGDLTTIKADIDNGLNVVKTATDSLSQIETFLTQAKAAANSARSEKDVNIRATYINQINETLAKMVDLAADANYDGINLVQAVADIDLTSAAGVAAALPTAAGTFATFTAASGPRAQAVITEADITSFLTSQVNRVPTGWSATGGPVTTQYTTAAGGAAVLGTAAAPGTFLGAGFAPDDGANYVGVAAGTVLRGADNNFYVVTTASTAGTPSLVEIAQIDVATTTTNVQAAYDVTRDNGAARAYQDLINAEVRGNPAIYQDLVGFSQPETLTVIFSEQDKSRRVDVQARALGDLLTGIVGGSSAIAVSAADWTATDGKSPDTNKIDAFTAKIDAAAQQVRAYAAELGNYSQILSVRGEFTDNMVNTLQGGAADLVNADMNQESANMLALQTRQQLGVIALSIAQQSEQAVLRLF